MKLSILGTGSFGTALAVHLASNFNKITMWGNNPNIIQEINIHHTNKHYIGPDVVIPKNITASENLEETIQNSKYIVLAVPSHAISDISYKIKDFLQPHQIIINLAKGIDTTSLERLSVIIQKNSLSHNIVSLSGPSHAEEILTNIPTAIVSASNNIELAHSVQKDFSTKTLRIYTNPDIIGVELGGAAKNIIALAAGIIKGLGYGDNTKAALMVRGMNEIIAIGTALGGQKETFNGLSGMGDLIVTCTSEHSRNNRAGQLLASGLSLQETLDKIGMVVEGVKACEAFFKLGQSHHIELPITNALYKILFDHENPNTVIDRLLLRNKKNEFTFIS